MTNETAVYLAVTILVLRGLWETAKGVRWLLKSLRRLNGKGGELCRAAANLARPACNDGGRASVPTRTRRKPKTNHIDAIDPEDFDGFLDGSWSPKNRGGT